MKKILIIIVFTFSTINIYAQLRNWEVGFMFGGSNYVGDINNMFANGVDNSKEWNQFESSFNMYNTHLMGGIIARYNFNPRWVLRLSASITKISGEDRHFDNIRNLSFYSSLQELSTLIEFNFLDYRTGSRQHRITPYMFGGLAIFHFNPKTDILDYHTSEIRTVLLHDMHTEGQTLEPDKGNYSLWQLSIPFGLGVKFSINEYICLGLEWGFRKTFTDYIDDISTTYTNRQSLLYNVNDNAVIASDRTNELTAYNTIYHQQGEMRGNSTTKDWYNFFGVTMTTRLSTGKTKCLKKK